IRAGERVSGPVSQVDVAPLVAAALGWQPPRDSRALAPDGLDPLSRGAESRAAHAGGVYFESYFGTKSFGWSSLAGWTDGRFKYVHSSAPELFDLDDDPGEMHSVLDDRTREAVALRERITDLCARPRLERAPLAGA